MTLNDRTAFADGDVDARVELAGRRAVVSRESKTGSVTSEGSFLKNNLLKSHLILNFGRDSANKEV